MGPPLAEYRAKALATELQFYTRGTRCATVIYVTIGLLLKSRKRIPRIFAGASRVGAL